MSTGIAAVFVETHNWGRTAAQDPDGRSWALRAGS